MQLVILGGRNGVSPFQTAIRCGNHRESRDWRLALHDCRGMQAAGGGTRRTSRRRHTPLPRQRVKGLTMASAASLRASLRTLRSLSAFLVFALAVLVPCGARGQTPTPTPSPTPTPDIVTGLVAYYPFNGNADDASGNGHHGVVNGATLTTDLRGNPNSAASFDGIDDFIEKEP